LKMLSSVKVGRGRVITQLSLVCALLLATLIVVVFASLGLGSMAITPLDILRVVAGAGEAGHETVLMKLRFPRMAVALLAGASLAAAGAALQGIIRNPLASPDLVGITGGASLSAVLFLNYGLGALSIRWLPAWALLGAAVVALLLYFLSWKRGVTPYRLVMVGVGVSSLMGALTTMLLIYNPQNEATQAYVWLVGSVYGSNVENVLTILPWTAVLLPLAAMMARYVNVGQLGDDVATGVGSRVEINRLILLLISVGLAGSAIAVAGGIGFVGLIAPHMARKLVGNHFGRLLPVAALVGAIVVTVADLAGRLLFSPLDVPAGVFTSAIGAPFFIYLLYAKRHMS
jgi:iron complex transport system permease protein